LDFVNTFQIEGYYARILHRIKGIALKKSDIKKSEGFTVQPDYVVMVNDFVKPVVSLFLLVFLLLGWATAFRLMKENTLLRIKLGKEKEVVREGFKLWMLRKTAPMVAALYSLNEFVQERHFYTSFKNLFKTKTLKVVFRYSVVTSIVSSIFSIDSSQTN